MLITVMSFYYVAVYLHLQCQGLGVYWSIKFHLQTCRIRFDSLIRGLGVGVCFSFFSKLQQIQIL